MLIDEKWTANWRFRRRTIRQISSFRNWVTPDGRPGPTGRGGFKAQAGRYHL